MKYTKLRFVLHAAAYIRLAVYLVEIFSQNYDAGDAEMLQFISDTFNVALTMIVCLTLAHLLRLHEPKSDDDRDTED